MQYQKTFYTILGHFTVIEEENTIIALQLEENKYQDVAISKDTPLLKQTEIQLQEYFAGKRMTFDLPVNPKGTMFQQKVWQQLQKIPYGKLVTYKDIAIKIGNPKAARAVGMANHNNPIPIIIPCHRVVGQNQKLVGYGLGLDKKEFLINLEKRLDKSNKIV